jgi:hypothetical protein
MTNAAQFDGPWTFQKCAADDRHFQLLTVSGKVIGLPYRGTGGRAEALDLEAKARLTAAAPTLLEACAAAWLALSDTTNNELRKVADDCKAAIDSATMGSAS